MRYVKLHNDRLQPLSGKMPDGVKACLVLGAKLRPDNSLSPILQLRVRLVSILANAYPDWLFYISGCRADTTALYRTLVEEYHIPEERFVLDSCGFNTFRSLWNMEVFWGQTRFYILTSSFHITRSLRIARWLGYEAWGIDISDYEKVKSNPYFWREQLAALRSLCLVLCVRTPIGHISRSFFRKLLLRRLRRNELQFDAQNEQILERAMKNVDQSMPLTEYFFQQLMQGVATEFTQPMEEEHLMVSLSHVDCTTVIEDVLALALCYRDGRTTLTDLKDYYRRMHYHDGAVSIATRNHYFTWIMQSAIKEGFVERISPDEPAFPFTGLMDLQPSYMTRNKHLFRPQMDDENNYKAIALRQQQQRVRFTYIPRELLDMPQDSELGVIHNGDIMAVVCDQHSWARGVEIKHLLIAKWISGRLHFYHATENRLELSNMDAYTFMKDKFTMIGVAVYRLKYDAA